MVLVGHQPNYLPYLGFFHKIYHCDLFVIVDNVQYVKRGPFGWISRNQIKTPSGAQWLTVPVLVKGKFEQKIMETAINTALPWGRKHWKSLVSNYAKAPHFSEHADFFEKTYAQPWDNLCDLNCHMIFYLMKAFGIETPVKKASEIGASGKGDELILDMCAKTGANQYLHGKHGKDYIDQTKFTERKITSLYQDFSHPVYHQQFGGDFIPNLSAIDLLFNYGNESIDILLGKKVIPL